MLEPFKQEIRHKNIVLASNSPRRSELLSKIGIEFEVFPSNYDEKLLVPSAYSDFKEYCKQLAYEKAHSILKDVLSLKNNIDIVISADTIVECGGKIFGKPENPDHADKILTLLSGKKHRVITGVCILVFKDKEIDDTILFHEETDVSLTDLSPEMIKHYVATGEPMGKAGAYAIQGLGSTFISRIEGDYYNVMGFPIYKFCKNLVQIFDQMKI